MVSKKIQTSENKDENSPTPGDYLVFNKETKKCSLVTEKDIQIDEMKQKCKKYRIHLSVLSKEIEHLKWKMNK